ncbi:WYL domain-containing protein [Caballeronia sp. GAWG1-1]|uniref:helix-turn-helix transcriptional regulator n=1 Tax=Caballeronia sp. GAWG1-1 TaxID=2921742 RepID=UPI0020291549|nr:WYL domain-containing protein [Caballeronia sp. GAWG1-1]
MLMLPDAREKTWMTTQDIRKRLAERGHIKEAKYVLRQMRQLEAAQKVISTEEEGKRPIFWKRAISPVGGHKSADHMSASEAVTFSLIERITKEKLPKAILGDVEGLFQSAKQRLKVSHDGRQMHKRWLDKIDTVDALFPLLRPDLDADVFNTIKDATFHERVLRVRYQSAGNKRDNVKARWRRVAPLALVESAGLMYVVAQEMDFPPNPEKGKFEWLRPPLRLDRIVQVEETKESFTYPADFSLEQYIKTDKAFQFMVKGEPFRIRLAFSEHAGDHLLESHVSADQSPPEYDERERLVISATVVDSLKLGWWLRSFGPAVEILEPQWLREKVADDARKAAQQYADC